MTASPIFRLPADERRAELERHVGKSVIVEVWPHRRRDTRDPQTGDDTRRSYAGTLVAVAVPLFGTVSDLVVIRGRRLGGGFGTWAISSAQVAGVMPTGDDPAEVERAIR